MYKDLSLDVFSSSYIYSYINILRVELRYHVAVGKGPSYLISKGATT